MLIFPAIDLYQGKAVRLYKGNYREMTVYSEDPLSVAKDFEAAGASCLHMVDLEGARDGGTPNSEPVRRIIEGTSLFTEIGGGIRDMATVERYIGLGAGRVVLGTAAVTDEDFLRTAVLRCGDKIAVSADLKDGYVAVKGWTEISQYSVMEFCFYLQSVGVKTLICTDISRDGAMKGTNLELYRDLSQRFAIDIIASGGVSSMEDIRQLHAMGLYGAIIGKAYYTGAIDLREAVREAGD